MPNIFWPMCALMGHNWHHYKQTPNWDYYECRICGRNSKDPR